jgi:hypothetical protein
LSLADPKQEITHLAFNLLGVFTERAPFTPRHAYDVGLLYGGITASSPIALSVARMLLTCGWNNTLNLT